MAKLNPILSSSEVEAFFRLMDTNGDNSIDFAEFARFWRPSMLTAMYPESYKPIKELFTKFDTDGDGAITLAEFKSAMKKQNPKMADKEIEAMMKRLDRNGDGNIDFREFAAMEIFK
jgi:calmodulin